MLITGSRTWDNFDVMVTALKRYARPGVVLVSGACPSGADAMAEQIWEQWGLPVERHPLDWRKGNRAGLIRNQEMVNLGADICLAFRRNFSSGTTHCGNAATIAGIPTLWFTEDEHDER